MIDDLRQIAIFAKTVDHGSFRAAAAELRLSPSVVSHHVAQLEEKLGVALLYRTTRRLAVTQQGERLLRAAREMLVAVEGGLRDLQEATQEPQGELKVTIPSVLSRSPLMDRIAAYAERYPKVSLQLEFSDERRNLLKDGFDAAIRMGPSRRRAPNRRTLFQTRRILVAAQSYLALQGQVTHPRHLAQLQGIDFSPARAMKSYLHCEGEEDFPLKLGSSISVNDAHALYQLAKAGRGVAAVPDYLARTDLATGEMVHLLPDWELEPLDVFAEWPANAPKEGIVRLFVESIGPSEP